ncbi:MAG TPA: LCP family protein [Pantanalinema sp.]
MSARRGLLLALSVLLGFGLGGVSGYVLGELRRPSAPVVLAPPAPASIPSAGEQTILVMASDAKGDSGRDSLRGNTDSMLLVHLEPATRRVSVLAIPRDTRTAIEGHGTFKVNAANAYGGPELAMRTVSRLVGVPIDRYLLVSLHGVRAAVDAIGGLEVTVPKRMRYRDRAGGLTIDLQPGRQHLSGRQVEAFLRFRHDEEGDIGRIQRHQAFMTEVASQVFSPQRFFQLPALWVAVREHVETDLSSAEALRIAYTLRGLDVPRGLELEVLPGHEDRSRGPWYWEADTAAIEPFLARSFRKQPPSD